MTQISGGGAPSFQIGSRPARKYAQYASTPTEGWAGALSEIGGAFIERHQKQKRKEAEEARVAKQAAQRTAWSKQVSQGLTVRDIAQRDPSIINDSDYLGFLSKNRPEAAAETFSTVHDPYGRGGVAQQSSGNGQYSGYQGPPPPKGPPETMTDKAGFHRYLGRRHARVASVPRCHGARGRAEDFACHSRVRASPESAAISNREQRSRTTRILAGRPIPSTRRRPCRSADTKTSSTIRAVSLRKS